MAGFIAAETARQLRDSGVAVVGCDNMNDYYDPRLKKHRLEGLKDCEFHQIDIEDEPALAKLFKAHQFDAVFNLAARAGVRYSMVNPDVYFTTNVRGTLNLLELMRKNICGKMVLASTSSLYAGEIMPFNRVDIAPLVNGFRGQSLFAERALPAADHQIAEVDGRIVNQDAEEAV